MRRADAPAKPPHFLRHFLRYNDIKHRADSAEGVKPRSLIEVFDANFFGLVEAAQALLPLIKKSDGGRIVNASSLFGSLTIQSKDGETAAFKPSSYDASKRR